MPAAPSCAADSATKCCEAANFDSRSPPAPEHRPLGFVPLAGFCASRGIRPDTLKWWKWHLRSKVASVAEAERAGIRLVAVDMVTPADSSGARPTTLAILVAGAELRVETGTDAAYVSELVMALRSRC